MRSVDHLHDAALDALARLAGPPRRLAARLRKRDPLTGVLRWPTWLQRADRRLRRRTAGAVLLFDLDGLSALNSTLGPDAGDACLIAFARLLVGTAGDGLVGRFGGDEFVLLVDDEAHGVDIAGRVRAATRQLFCAERTRVVAHDLALARSAVLTVSVGAARRHGKATIGDLITRCEQAVRQAKNAGRDCVRWAD